jgi:hypothetical protein
LVINGKLERAKKVVIKIPKTPRNPRKHTQLLIEEIVAPAFP